MPTAFEKVQEQFEAARKECIAEGRALGRQEFADALQLFIQDYLNPPPPSHAARRPAKTKVARASNKRRAKGENKQAVRVILEVANGSPMGPTAIVKALLPDEVAYVSVRHALDQLHADGVALQVNGTDWVINPNAPSSEEDGAIRPLQQDNGG